MKSRIKSVAIFITTLAVLTVSIKAFLAYKNSRGQTEARATQTAELFTKNNKIAVKRLTCAGDSDGDGYGSCSVVTQEESKIILKCPSDYLNVEFFKATGCKEVFSSVGLTVGRGTN